MFMKVEGPSKAQQTEKSKKKGRVASTGGGFSDLVTGGAEETAGASATRSIAQVDTLLSVQATEDPTEKAARKRMYQRADTLLDRLENIRLRLLTGTLTVGHVIDIADVIAAHREKIADPELTAILDEIDLRAQIEIAKMRMAMGS
jgi:hypothetical protein